MNKNFVIFAPHVDDEVIGAWKLLKAGLVSKVFYFYEVDDVRKKEAEAAGLYYGFEPVFLPTPDAGHIRLPLTDIILVPNIKDRHPHHKMVNYIARSFTNVLMFYSVDMNVKYNVLWMQERETKRTELLTLFPSQSKLLESDEKYHLFESLLDSDMEYSFSVTSSYKTVTIWTETELDSTRRLIENSSHVVHLMNALIALYPLTRIKVQFRYSDNSEILEFNPE